MRYYIYLLILASIIGYIVYLEIQSGSIHLYFSNEIEEKMIEEENHWKYRSGDIRFNKGEQNHFYYIPITVDNNSSNLYAYADRKSFAFLNRRVGIHLLDDEGGYVDGCVVRSKEFCEFEIDSTLPAGDYTVRFSSTDKHTWELWVKVE